MNAIMPRGQTKEHVFGKSVRRPHHQGPGCGWSTPLVVGQLFTVALSQVGTGEGHPRRLDHRGQHDKQNNQAQIQTLEKHCDSHDK